MKKDSFIIFIRNSTAQKFEFNDSVSQATHIEGGCRVTFNNGKSYNYGSKRVKIYSLKSIRNNVYVYRDGILICGYNLVKDYGEYFLIYNEYGSYQVVENNGDIEVTDIKVEVFQGESIIEYFRYMLRTIVKLSFDDTLEDDDNNINHISNNHLLKALDGINIKDSRSVFSNYIDGVLPSFKKTNKTIIYPFGCNESQKTAVEAALQNNMSIIEGPPGTGKTQTILNIIANLVVQGKTIGVVSNNNSAIFNILDKLQKSNYDMIAASLGNKQNKTDFFNNIQDQTPNKELEVSDEKIKEYKKEIRELYSIITKCFQYRNRLSILKTNLSDVIIEYKHIKAEQFISPDIKSLLDSKFYRKLNVEKVLKLKDLLFAVYVGNKLSFKDMLIFIFQYGILDLKTITIYQDELFVYVNHKFYELHIDKIELEIKEIENWLLINNEKYNLKRFVYLSNKVFNNMLLKKYTRLGNASFTMSNYINQFDKFVKHYPVILSSTHSLHTSIPNNYILDYLIIDEASQVDLITSSICFSCSRNVVVVGDSMQLTHIVEKQAEEVMIKSQYNLHSAYNYVNHNILNSLKELYGDKIESTLLREHYRCHPTIIGFCNKKYYNNDLIVMTKGDNHPFRIIETNIDGERGNYSQKQIDETNDYIEKRFKDKYKNIGVIAPYRIHVEGLQRKLNNGVESDTIHKFQGRDKDVIIFNLFGLNSPPLAAKNINFVHGTKQIYT